MTFNETMQQLIAREWEMFHNVNGSTRAACQEDRWMFESMRRAQFSAWSQDALESYLQDVEAAAAAGRNLAREKYIHMMRSTDPEDYALWSGELPAASPDKTALIAQLWAHFEQQTLRMRETYPALALGGRTLYARDEQDHWASIETYQTSELLTYSVETLRRLLHHMEALEQEGVDLVYRIQENSVTCTGYASMEEAEHAMTMQVISEMGSNCSCGGGSCGV